jgi:tetratricopeptide (TPR) repeat protein
VTAYTLGDVARICGVSRRRVRYWERTALIGAADRTADDGAQPSFDFRDLVSVRRILGLIEQGVPLRRIRDSADAVRERYPELEPLPVFRTWRDAPRVLLHHDGAWMEPDGQLVLDFVPEAVAGRVAALTEHPGVENALEAARAWFERGCELDIERATWDEAEACYRRALALDPGCADAFCNLGSLFFNRGRRDVARGEFERAVAVSPRHVEAHLNLGTLCEEDGDYQRALAHYRQSLESDPLFPGVHVSMALCYEKLGLLRTALVHWKRYLQLEPEGSWVRVARLRLELPN